MCYLYRSIQFDDEMFAEDVENAISERTDLSRLVYSMKPAPIIRADGDKLILEERDWGWLPANWKPSEKYKTRKKYQRERINCRNETVDSTWGFKFEFNAGQRCVMIADAFHEPQSGTDGNFFAWEGAVGIAGIYADYNGDETIRSCTMLTCDANQLVKENRSGRPRMPVVLTKETAAMWLDPDRSKREDFAEVFEPFPADMMEIIEVKKG